MLSLIIDNRFAIASVILFVTGFVNMMVHPNLIKKIVSFNIMDSAAFLMLASRGMIAGRTAAILTDGGANTALYVNPIPRAWYSRALWFPSPSARFRWPWCSASTAPTAPWTCGRFWRP